MKNLILKKSINAAAVLIIPGMCIAQSIPIQDKQMTLTNNKETIVQPAATSAETATTVTKVDMPYANKIDVMLNASSVIAAPSEAEMASSDLSKASIQTPQEIDKLNDASSNLQNMISLGFAVGGATLSIGGAMLMTNRRLPQFKKSEFQPANSASEEPLTKPADAIQSEDTAAANESELATSKGLAAKVQEASSDHTQLAPTQQSSQEKNNWHLSASWQAYVEPDAWMTALQKSPLKRVKRIDDKRHALTTITGQRSENQDYVCSFEIFDVEGAPLYQVMVVADGCGGHLGGKDASCIATRFASESIIQNVDCLSPMALLKNAFGEASNATQKIGTQSWQPHDLRTTLIVTIATPTHYHIGWIGDGGVSVHRHNGIWEDLIQPHKGEIQNLLNASLGPTQDGEPSFTVVPRREGDLFYMGSDGVFDVVDHSFWAWFEDALPNTDLPQTPLDSLINAASQHPSFDDNMSIAFLKTPMTAVDSTSWPPKKLPEMQLQAS